MMSSHGGEGRPRGELRCTPGQRSACRVASSSALRPVQDDLRGLLARYDVHVVGSRVHDEYWIPVEELQAFNDAIVGTIVRPRRYRALRLRVSEPFSIRLD